MICKRCSRFSQKHCNNPSYIDRILDAPTLRNRWHIQGGPRQPNGTLTYAHTHANAHAWRGCASRIQIRVDRRCIRRGGAWRRLHGCNDCCCCCSHLHPINRGVKNALDRQQWMMPKRRHWPVFTLLVIGLVALRDVTLYQNMIQFGRFNYKKL